MTDVAYVIMCEEHINGDTIESWVHAICKDSLTAEEACAKMNAEPGYTKYCVEEHELYG